jgi:hypothetical protein
MMAFEAAAEAEGWELELEWEAVPVRGVGVGIPGPLVPVLLLLLLLLLWEVGLPRLGTDGLRGGRCDDEGVRSSEIRLGGAPIPTPIPNRGWRMPWAMAAACECAQSLPLELDWLGPPKPL